MGIAVFGSYQDSKPKCSFGILKGSLELSIKWALGFGVFYLFDANAPFFQKHSQTMEQISAEINQLNTKIDDIEVLLKKTFKDWSEEENNLYGIEEQEARKQLREERKQLREQQTILFRNREMTNAGGILGIKFLS